MREDENGKENPSTSTEAMGIVAKLGLQPHPEGGWYRETWRERSEGGGRGLATAIYFLLEAGQRSHWHRVDAAELWLWHAGGPVSLCRAEDDRVVAITLGPDVVNGERPQALVPADAWQAAHAPAGWALVSCVVAPGFDFSGFTLAAPGWVPQAEQALRQPD